MAFSAVEYTKHHPEPHILLFRRPKDFEPPVRQASAGTVAAARPWPSTSALWWSKCCAPRPAHAPSTPSSLLANPQRLQARSMPLPPYRALGEV